MKIQVQTAKIKKFFFYAFIVFPLTAIGIILLLSLFRNMNNSKSIHLSNLQLYVRDLSLQKDFYTELVGLNILEETDTNIKLGMNEDVVLELIKEDSYSYSLSQEAGLYHSALVYETRPQLAAAINRIFQKQWSLYQGSSDHGATEAFYFADPEGNGVELYFDKPLEEVSFDASGKPIMGSVYIDEQMYVQKYINFAESEASIRIGHIHLKVGNINQAKEFYVNTLNFDIMSQSNQTLFISKDNYHHHIGMNTWESVGAGQRLTEKYGLKSFKIEYLSKELFNSTIANVEASNTLYTKISENLYQSQDPWKNIILLELK